MLYHDLKFSILEKAVTGQLVPQSNEDTPAEYLINDILEKKKKLLHDKIIKSEFTQSYIYKRNGKYYESINGIKTSSIEDILPFKIPDNWYWVRLGTIVQDYYHLRKSLSKNGRLNQQNNFAYYGPNGIIDYLTDYTYDGDYLLVAEDSKVFDTDDDYAYCVSDKFSANKHVHVLDFNPANNRFIMYYLNALNLRLSGFISGSNIPKLNKTNLYEILVPLPPIEEQQRIVRKLDNIHEDLIHYKNLQSKLNNLNKNCLNELKYSMLTYGLSGKLTKQDINDNSASSLLEDIRRKKDKLIKDKKIKPMDKESLIVRIDDHYYEKVSNKEEYLLDNFLPFTIPSNWCWTRLYNYADIRYGAHKSLKYVDEGIPFITSQNLKNEDNLGRNYIDFNDVKYISEEDYEKISKNLKIEKNNILFANMGNIGNPQIIKEDMQMGMRNIILFKPYLPNQNVEYIYYILKLSEFNIRNYAKSINKSYVIVNLIKEYLIPIPPIEEQKRIVAKFNEILNNLVDENFIENLEKLYFNQK